MYNLLNENNELIKAFFSFGQAYGHVCDTGAGASIVKDGRVLWSRSKVEGDTMARFTAHDFANYRNLARRAESTNDRADELRYLEKCLEIYEWRHGVDCTVDTFTDIVNRVNFLRKAK